MSENPQTTSPKNILSRMLVGNQVQQSIYVAAKLGIADLLQSGSKTCEELGEMTSSNPNSLYRLMRVLASFGVFREIGAGQFESTPVGDLLQNGTQESQREFALWSGGVSYQVFGGLEDAVKSGQPVFKDYFGLDFFDYLSSNPETGALFDDLMRWNTQSVANYLSTQDYSNVTKIVDVGGGIGTLLAAILRQHPHLKGVLADMPRVMNIAKDNLVKAGVWERCQLVIGNVMDSVPKGGDIYFIKNVLHGLNDDQALQLLTNLRNILSDGGELKVIEFLIENGTNKPFPGKLMDLLMLVGCEGHERTESEFRVLFQHAGLKISSIDRSPAPFGIITGIPATTIEPNGHPVKPNFPLQA